MGNIFEELDILIHRMNESGPEPEKETDGIKKIKMEYPIHPDMTTSEQGEEMAMEKIAKYFYELSAGGSDELTREEMPSLPDDFIDPVFKGEPGKDKTFEKNKALFDPEEEEELEKFKKEVNAEGGDSDDDFDDFDYRDNEFGDDIDDEDESDDKDESEGGSGGDGGSEKSESERLKDDINDALDELKSSGSDGESSSSGSDGKSSSSDSDDKSSSSGSDGESSSSSSDGAGSRMSEKEKRLNDIKDAIEKKDSKGLSKAVDDAKKEGALGKNELAGQNIGDVSVTDLKSDMEKAGVSDKDIESMGKEVNKDTMSTVSGSEMEKLKKEIIDGLDGRLKSKGGSKLAKTAAELAMRSKINDDEWRELLKMFMKGKAKNTGHMKEVDDSDFKYGNKNHLWRGAVLPTTAPGQGQIQRVYCFIDFSASVNKDLMYVFVGRVIDLCLELKYTDIVIYGFGNKIVLPKVVDKKFIDDIKRRAKGADVKMHIVEYVWNFIKDQKPGENTENFSNVATEIVDIYSKEKDAIFLIFGDGLWGDERVGPATMRQICSKAMLKNVCVLAYYRETKGLFSRVMGILRDYVGIENIICTKVTNLEKDKKREEV